MLRGRGLDSKDLIFEPPGKTLKYYYTFNVVEPIFTEIVSLLIVV